MAINNTKSKPKTDIKLADQEPQREQKPERGPGHSDSKDDGQGVDIIPTSDYKINLDGKKYKAHRIIFNKGNDDGKKGVTEQMKKTLMKKTFKELSRETDKADAEFEKNEHGFKKFPRKKIDEKISIVHGAPPVGQSHDQTTVQSGIHSGTIYTGKPKPTTTNKPTLASKPTSTKKPSPLEAIRARMDAAKNKTKNEEVQIDESWIVHDSNGKLIKKFSTHKAAKAHAEKTGHEYASAEFYHDKIQKNVKEEVQIDELKAATVAKYQDKAFDKYMGGDNKRAKGLDRANKKQVGAMGHVATTKEEAEMDEELKGGQVKLDKNKNDKLDAQDFKLLRNKSKGKVEEEVLDEAIDADDYTTTSEKSQFGGHRPHVVNKETGKTMHLSATSYEKPEHAKAHAQAYLSGYAKLGMHAADRAATDFAKANKQHMFTKDSKMNEDLHPEAGKVLKHIKPEHHAKYKPDLAKGVYKGDYPDRSAILSAAEKAGHLKENAFDYKNTPRETSDKTKTSTYHDVKKTSTGTVYTKQFDKDGMSKGTGGDAAAKADNAPKRGRGRPKKDKFAESVEVLMSLSEEQFDSMMEEGFDAFFEAYEQLDELSKTTLNSYAKKASRDSTITRKIGADFEHQAKKARSPGMKAAATSLADKYKSKSWKRRDGVDKAIDKLTK
jgi:hypothetical protein